MALYETFLAQTKKKSILQTDNAAPVDFSAYKPSTVTVPVATKSASTPTLYERFLNETKAPASSSMPTTTVSPYLKSTSSAAPVFSAYIARNQTLIPPNQTLKPIPQSTVTPQITERYVKPPLILPDEERPEPTIRDVTEQAVEIVKSIIPTTVLERYGAFKEALKGNFEPLQASIKTQSRTLIPRREDYATEEEYKAAHLRNPLMSFDPTNAGGAIFATIRNQGDDIAKVIAKTSSADDIARILKGALNISDDKVDDLARTLAPMSKVDDIKNVLSKLDAPNAPVLTKSTPIDEPTTPASLRQIIEEKYIKPTLKPAKGTTPNTTGKGTPTPPRPPLSPSQIDAASPEGTKLSTIRKLFTSGRKILEKSGPSGKELSKLLEKQRIDEDLLTGEFNLRVKEALKGLSKKERLAVTDLLENKAPFDTKRTEAAATKIRRLLDEIANRAEADEFMIRVGDKTVPFKRREDYFPRIYDLDAMAKGARRTRTLEHLVQTGQARNIPEAEKLLDDYIAANAQRRAGNLENARLLDLPDYERDPQKALASYVSTVARRFTQAENFGKADEVVAGLINRITNEGGDYQEAQRIFDFIVDGLPKNKLVSAITQFNTATKLSLGAVTNATQTVNTMTKIGIKNTIKAIYKAYQPGGEGRKLAELVNIYDEQFLIKEGGFEPAKILKGALYLFKKVEDFNRRTTATAGKVFAQDLVEQLQRDPQSRYVIRQLDSLGISLEKAQKGLSERDLLEAAHNLITKVQFRPDPIELPPSWRTPTGRLITQFKSFLFMQTKFARDEIIKEARHGNFYPLVTFIATAVPASYVASTVRNFLTGREEGNIDIREWDKWMKAFGTIPTEAVIQAKFLYDTMQSDLKTPIEKGARVAGTFFGPTADEIGKFIGAMEQIPRIQEENKWRRKTNEERDPLLAMKRQAVEKIPYVGQYLKNRFFYYPKSKKTDEERAASRAMYDKIDNWLDKPYGDPAVRQEVIDYMKSLPNDDERSRQLYIMSENGIDTKGISSSKKILEFRPTFDKVQDLVAEGREQEAKAIVKALSDEEYETYKKIRASEKSKKTSAAKEAMVPTYERVQELKAEGRIDEAKAIVDAMTEEEYRIYKLVKQSYE